MSTAIAVRSDPSQTLPAKIAYARALADSGLLPAAYRCQPANVLYAVEYGDMLGLSPMAAITGIHIIEGKPSASAGLISALVRRAGHQLRVKGTDTMATAQVIRADDPDFTFEATWTLERAKAAELTGKGNWKKYPAAMLKARAISEVARDACEEALFGLHYTPEELGADVDEDGAVIGGVVTGEPAPQQPASAPAPALDSEWLTGALERAVTFADDEAGQKLWTEGKAKQEAGEITGPQAKRLTELIKARWAELRAEPAEPVVEGVVVVDPECLPEQVLEDGDPWAAKIEEITSAEDLTAVLDEVDALAASGQMDDKRAERVRLAANYHYAAKPAMA